MTEPSSGAWEAFSGRLFDQNQFAVKLGLDNIRQALAAEGHPERSAPAIVVGGTNGKGTTAAFLAAILQAHGLRVGLYTSPHLVEVRERFRVDGIPASRAEVLRLGADVLARYGDPSANPCLTFFELTTLIAALLFREAEVDVAVYEVGLGGRLDAVNAIEPSLTVITNIDLDHQKYLGDDVVSIAREKAALRRPNVPLVVAPQTWPAARRELEFPDTLEAPTRWEAIATRDRNFDENVSVARLAAEQFLRDRYDEELAKFGVGHGCWPGRLDWRSARGATFLLDAAHNPGGAARLRDVLMAQPPKLAIVGAMADKDFGAMFEVLRELGTPTYLAEIDSARAASAAELREVLASVPILGAGPSREMFDAAARDVHAARASRPRPREDAPYCVVFGSIYLLGEWFRWAGIDASEFSTWVDEPQNGSEKRTETS